MSAVLPPGKQAQIQFFLQHVDKWKDAAATIGLDALEVDAFKVIVEAAAAAEQAAFQARDDSRSATKSYDTAFDKMSDDGRALIATIKAYAEKTGDEDVYARAAIPAPKPASPAPPAEAPTELVADPIADGTIMLKWKGTLSQGQSFDIERSIDGEPFTFIKNRPAKSFHDMAVPMNTNMIRYRVYGTRDSVRSVASATADVLFGNLPPALQAAFRSGPIAEAA